jgi:hypothetical protein
MSQYFLRQLDKHSSDSPQWQSEQGAIANIDRRIAGNETLGVSAEPVSKQEPPPPGNQEAGVKNSWVL